jgi:serine/arginine repetitive matrix protein 1
VQVLDPKAMQVNLIGFLNARRSREFMAELWSMLLAAQKTTDGIPPQLIADKVEELKRRQVCEFLMLSHLLRNLE